MLLPSQFNKTSQPSITGVLEMVEITERDQILCGVALCDANARDSWDLDFSGTTPALGINISNFSLFGDNE